MPSPSRLRTVTTPALRRGVGRRPRTIVAAVIAAFAAAVVTPANAFAIDLVDCTDHDNFLRITENYREDHCYANAGVRSFYLTRTFWASKIDTGNNDTWWEADGHWNYLPRWYVLTFPTVGTVRLREIKICGDEPGCRPS